ncbi:hypothetical protein TIFTF001_032862 [Ficus carica]|uniref:Uncharacterized protein n=1 Tax=Ficus carica TaxID=3494 RepID=A0AA88DXY7_FICCA|nr:hypothetical protein TIFTF001_032862 [Ficus carica]
MKNPKHELALQLLLLTVVLLITTVTSGSLKHKVYVSMTNGLRPDLTLTTHCKSTNDDLGIQELPFDRDQLLVPFSAVVLGRHALRLRHGMEVQHAEALRHLRRP